MMNDGFEEIHGYVEELVFRKPESGFTVLELSSDEEYITVVGVLPEIAVGEELKLRGKWVVHQTSVNSSRRSFAKGRSRPPPPIYIVTLHRVRSKE